jgi:hypothetical protein
LQIYEEYIKHPFHYPKIAKRIKSHLELYPECECQFWLPNGEQKIDYDYLYKMARKYEGKYFQGTWGDENHSQCSNCLAYLHDNNMHDEETLMKEIFVFEYVSCLLNATKDKHVINLCNCCYKQFKNDFIELV